MLLFQINKVCQYERFLVHTVSFGYYKQKRHLMSEVIKDHISELDFMKKYPSELFYKGNIFRKLKALDILVNSTVF